MTVAVHNSDTFLSVEDMLTQSDESIRHSTPISEVELGSMVEYVEQTKSYTKENNPTWSYLVSTPTFNYIKTVDEVTDVLKSRSWVKVPLVPPQVLFYLLHNSKERIQFDKYYTRFEVSRVVDESLDVLISEIDAPLGISNREFLEWRRIAMPPSLSAPKADIKYVVYLRSCGDRECSELVKPNPNPKKVQRAEVWMSGYITSWWISEETGEILGSQLLVMSHVDGRGSIPKIAVKAVNALSQSGPTKWTTSLINRANRFCQEKGISVSMSDSDIEAAIGLSALRISSSLPSIP